jgi:hypothetical protein
LSPPIPEGIAQIPRTALYSYLLSVSNQAIPHHPAGGFYSNQDADSEGEEGKFFVWTPDGIRGVLGDEADEFIEAYGVKRGGNWEGKNILELTGTLGQREKLADARAKLFGAREARMHPGRDEKVLTSWSGLMLATFAEVAPASNRGGCCQIAGRDADEKLRGHAAAFCVVLCCRVPLSAISWMCPSPVAYTTAGVRNERDRAVPAALLLPACDTLNRAGASAWAPAASWEPDTNTTRSGYFTTSGR